MSRSLKKGPYIDPKLLKKIQKYESEVIVTKDKKMVIRNFGVKERLLIHEPKRIVNECNLPANWEEPIRNLLKSGKLQLPAISSLQPILSYNFEKQKWELFIQIFRKTTAKDLERADWNLIKELQSRWLKDFEPIEISDTDIRMIELYNQGKSMREIGETIYGNRPFDETEISKRCRLVKKKLHMSRDKKG
ncbi:MAG: hypothetical protein UU26_C0012G0001 [Candidatus Daviesbacteria bacterium GW2011_GWC1_40_9]|nr:MAG: hypothetical protein UU26_C0012G0001 [Candidatus Daviesbacteria bacterium GW2011_GWC1_40_9]